MADPPQTLGTAPAGNDPASAISELPPCSLAQLDQTVVATMEDTGPQHDPEPCTGIAMFSTELGKRASRKIPSLPLPPVIVRSSIVESVVAFAHHWLSRYPMQYLCIFDNCGWTIHDLWDAEDIHIESPAFCQETLNFIGRDNYYRAKKYAMQWSHIHQSRLNIIEGEMEGFYDPQDPLGIVNKIFIDGEAKFHPRTFLWHVAHIIRASMVEAARTKLVAIHAGIVQQETPMRIHRAIAVSRSMTRAESLPAQRTMIGSPADKGTYASSHLSENETTEPHVQAPTINHEETKYTDPYTMKRKASHGPQRQGEYQHEMMGPMRLGIAGPHAMLPDMNQQNLSIPKGKCRHKGPDIYGRSMRPTGWVENPYHTVSGGMHRHGPGSPPMMPSPHFNAASMGAGQPVGSSPHMVPPFVPVHPMASPPMPGILPMHPSLMQHGGVPPHPMQVPAPSTMIHCHRYLSEGQGPPGLMADVTNMPHPVEISIPNTERRRSSIRHNGQYYGNGGALFDPYDGTRPSFNSPAAPHSSKKHHQNGFQNQPGRPRKPSMPGGRSEPVQYGSEKAYNTYNYANRGYGPNRRHSSEDNPEITQDSEKGCHSHWIGPKNETVKEVFIGDLPEDIQVAEIECLFQLRIAITPAYVSLPAPSGNRHQSRRHAFVTFKDVSEAKQAISIPKPMLRESQITITVPRRFYQRPCASPPTHATDSALRSDHFRNGRRAENQKAKGSTHVSLSGSENNAANAIKAATENIYSPQDARSGLPIKPEHVRQAISSSTGSPSIRKSGPKKRQESPTKAPNEKAVDSSPANLKHSKDCKETNPSDSTSLGPISTIKPRISGSEADVQDSEHNSDCSKSLEVADHSLQEPPVLKLGVAQDVSETLINSSGAQNEGVVQRSSDKREEADTKSDPNSESNGVSALSMGPITTEHVSPTEVFAPAVDKETFEFPTEDEETLSVEKAALYDEAEIGVRFSSVRESQSNRLVAVPNLVTQFSEMSANDRGPTSVSTNGLSRQEVPSILTKTETMLISLNNDDGVAMSVASKDNGILDSGIEGPDRAEPTPPVEMAKKNPAPQTQSLFPFARPSKNQLKREKEQKKKALRKEKAEQAEKLKATKTAGSDKANSGSATKPKVEETDSGANEVSRHVASEKAKANHESGNHGKQKGANASSLPHEIDSETPKATMNFSRLTDSEHILSPPDAASLSLQASAPGSTVNDEIDRKEKFSGLTVVKLESTATSTEVYAPSPAFPLLVPAISHPNHLHQLQPSTPLSDTNEYVPSKRGYHIEKPLLTAPTSSEIDTDHIECNLTSQEVEVAPCQDTRNDLDRQVTNHASVSLHAVPRAPPAPPQIDDAASETYSPGKDEFHTPLQTPSTLMTQNEMAPTDKKSGINKKTARNNARKKKRIAKLQQSDKTTEFSVSDKPTKVLAADEPIRDDEPFSSQMMHIDAVRNGAVVESQEDHFHYARNLVKEYGDELGWDLEELSKVSKPSGEKLDIEAVRRYEAAQVRVAEIWVRESHAHDKSNDLDGFWSKEEMSERGAI